MRPLRLVGPRLRAALLLGLCLGGGACSPRVTRGAPDPAVTSPEQDRFSGPWRSTEQSEHPWVGRVFDVAEGKWVTPAVLEARVARTRWVLLGETHDNPDHHRLQAELLRTMASGQRRPAVAFEMIDSPKQPQLDQARTPEEVAAAVQWDESGWPAFALYRPLFEVAAERGLPLVAANLPRQTAKELVMKGADVLPPDARAQLEANPLSAEAEQRLRAQLVDSHCGHLPESMAGGFVLAQRARDAHLAARLRSGATADGAALIAGAGHVRRDYGVPSALGSEIPRDEVLSVALLEVPPAAATPGQPPSPEEPEPARVAAFDFVVFTPRFARKDPCLGMKLPPVAAPRKDGGT